MRSAMTSAQLLDRDFLEVRCRLIDVAACMDRWAAAGGAPQPVPSAGHESGVTGAGTPATPTTDRRLEQIALALAVLADGLPDKAERVQMHFSDPYDDGWRARFGL